MNTSYNKVIYTKKDGVATIVLNNPKRYNALELDLRRELKTALEDAAGDSSVRVVVLRGAGGNFSA
ncbi:MAG: enoyl-CoA hydratase/isomerase family protein, partial [Candidatus Caldarchaeum sp.]